MSLSTTCVQPYNESHMTAPTPTVLAAAASVPPAAAPTAAEVGRPADVDPFDILRPVLVGVFLLWWAVVLAVGSVI